MTSSVHWHPAPASLVLSHIANAILGPAEPPAQPLNGIVLHAHQHDALARLRTAMRLYGGALLADAVGLGKTYVALALAREYRTARVLAPATLLPMWRAALATTASTNVTVHSLHALSRRPLPPPPYAGLVIIDEAHALRTRTTRRYQNAARTTAGQHVLLLSATPLHNRARDLRHLLSLFLGTRADALDAHALSQCVVRRTHTAAATAALPRVHEHPPHATPENPPVLELLLQLPPPLPAHNGAAAGALVRLGLLRAWCSSDAALTTTIRHRQMRGEALLHALAHGRYPTRRELQSWTATADSIQLGFPEILATNTSTDTAALLKTLTVHLDALHTLLQLHTRTALADPHRAAILRALLQTPPASNPPSATDVPDASAPIVAFSQFASTVHALYRALGDLAGIASLTAAGGRIAGGPLQRQELLARFAPRAHGRPPPPRHERIRLLITTDMLAEGVNLQDAAVVVHLDLPWTDAQRIQRIGRLARLGTPHQTVHVHTFAPPPGMEHTLHIVATLERKATLAASLVGAHPPAPDTARGTNESAPDTARGTNESAPDAATRLRNRLTAWRTHAAPHPPAPLVACVPASATGWIAAVEHHGTGRVIACTNADDAGNALAHDTAPDDATAVVLRTLDTMADPETVMTARCTPDANAIAHAIAALDRWSANAAIDALAGPTHRALAPIQQRALQRLAQRVSATPPASRPAVALAAAQARTSILQARGAGVEMALEEWCTLPTAMPLTPWLTSLGTPLIPTGSVLPADPSPRHGEWRLTSLLLLVAAPRPHTPSPPTPDRTSPPTTPSAPDTGYHGA